MDRESKTCCDSRLNGVRVALSNNRLGPRDYSPEIGRLDNVQHRERIEIIPRTPKGGRYLKIWLPRRDQLSLCEVEVIQEKG